MGWKSRRIWIKSYGPIPKDDEGFSYEIHHIDGNNKNDTLSNLKLLTIKEHLKIHLDQGDYGAVSLIAKRMRLGPEYQSNIQRGVKRPGIGGRKKGSIPWNIGRKHSEESKLKMSKARKGKVHSTKFSIDIINEIRSLYESNPKLIDEECIGKNSRNGKPMTYDRLFSKQFHKKYGMTASHLYNLITKKEVRKDV